MDSKAKNNLSIQELTVSYGDYTVINHANLNLPKGRIVSIIGEDGSGKSTLFNAIIQNLPYSGKVVFNDTESKDLTQVTTDKLVYLGIDFVLQGGNILNSFTVREHIELANQRDKTVKDVIGEIYKVFPRMKYLENQIAGRLSGGERMMLSLGCLLASDGSLIILDEPTSGLAPELCDIIQDFLIDLRNQGKAILLMENNFDFVFNISDFVATLKRGKLSKLIEPEVFKKPNFIETTLYN